MTSSAPSPAPRRAVVLGSTGSIGTQTLEVLARCTDAVRLHGLAVSGSRPETAAQQVLAHAPARVAIADEDAADQVAAAIRAALAPEARDMPRLDVGEAAVVDLAGALGAGDVVVNAVTGSVGLCPTLAALASGARLALANKESLIAGGELVTGAAAEGQILPVDSEHTAIAQALAGVRPEHVDRLVVTASGGPFRGRSRAELGEVTPEQALAHPTWQMGRVITTNSATLVNKALEVIEACWLFDMPEDRVDVVVHPQSIVHSMATLIDGSTIAQASPPDMRHAIGWAIAHPEKIPGLARPLDFTRAQSWTFEPVDEETFGAIALARAAHRRGHGAMAAYNAANEEAVDAFFAGRLPFLGIVDVIGEVLADPGLPTVAPADGVDGVLAVERAARAIAGERIAARATAASATASSAGQSAGRGA